MTEHDFLLAWYVYLGASALGYLAGWQLTGWMWRWLREPLRLAAAILLFTPTLVDAARDLYAPAVIVVALDLLFGAGSSLLTALLDLGTVASVTVPLWLGYCLVRWLLQRRRASRAATGGEAEEAASMLEMDAPLAADERREPAV